MVEIAPAPNLDDQVRQSLYRDAISFAATMGYRNAGTVEFLLETSGERTGQHVFIEMNPRIQVEHTVTEEITDVDLVGAQMRIAAGETLADLGLVQDELRIRSSAMQCRITTEDPANGFRPDVGTVTAYRSAGGSGIRLDGGTVYTGAEISPHFDSMLVKLTCRGHDYMTAVQRARRALAEFRIRGVATNIPFLMNVLDSEEFLSGDVATDFIDAHPELTQVNRSQDRGSKALQYLADVTVNQPYGPRVEGIDPRDKLPRFPGDKTDEPDRSPFDGPSAQPKPAGWRDLLVDQGPEAFAAALRERTALAVTDTTFRDAHQSLLATRVRTRDLLAAAPAVAHTTPGLFSAEVWGGATYDVALRFLQEDPWQRLALLREEMPNIPLQMLLRGRNTVGYTPYPLQVTDSFVAEAAATGVDIFRIFDALNDVDQIIPAIRAVRATSTAVAEAALCYTGNLTDPDEDIYTLDYYLGLAERMVEAGAHILAIKDMAGLLRPAAAEDPGHRAARAFRCAGSPAHPRHCRRAAGHPAGRLRSRGRRSGCGDLIDGGHHLTATGLSAGGGPGGHRARHRPGPGRSLGHGALLGNRARHLQPLRIRAAGTDRAGLSPQDPRWAALQPASAGHRPGAGGAVRTDRGDVQRRRQDAGPTDQSHPLLQSRRRPGPAAGRPGRLTGRVCAEPGRLRPARLGHWVPRRPAGRPAGGLARALPVQSAGGPNRQAGH